MRRLSRNPMDCKALVKSYAYSMQISDTGLREFIAICKEDFGVEFTAAAARVRALEILLLYEIMCQPLPHELRPIPPVPSPNSETTAP